MTQRHLLVGACLLVTAGLAAAGCGSTSTTAPQTKTTAPAGAAAPKSSTSPATTASPGPSALTPEVQQAAAGDIPDNQVFLTFRDPKGGYSIRYPEGWAERGSATALTFQDKNNLVRITIAGGGKVTAGGASAEMKRLRTQTPSLRSSAPTQITLSGKPAVKVVYSTESASNPVTGKRVKLVVDRYYLAGTGRHAVVDLGTPEGVDNVDAYRLMIESFRWK